MAPATYPDQWRSERFTSSEIDQLILVASELSSGAWRLSARKLSPKVRSWLKRWSYAEQTADGFTPTALLASQYGDSWLPIEALWRIVRPMLNADGYSGYSIRRNRRWAILNLFCADQHAFTDRDESKMLDVLCLLAAHGYIWFQCSASVWEISERKDQKVIA